MSYEEQAQNMLNAYKGEIEQSYSNFDMPPIELASGRAILQAEPQVQMALLRIILWLPLQQLWSSDNYYGYKLYKLQVELCKKTLPYTADDINDLLRTLSSIELPLLRAQRDRLERLPLSERLWSLTEWRERYLEHPLLGHLAQRLLWRFNTGEQTISAIWLDGQLVDATDHPLSLLESTQVSAWHSVLCSPAEVLQWRNWLERHQITQPFKQAHREVYLLTDAERTTRVYSNRFAAHILRQHQFNALRR